MSTQQERKVFAEWYWGGKTESERSYFYRSGSLRPGRTRDIWSAWQKGASVAKAEADASLASKDAEIARLREVVDAVPKTSGPLWGDCDTVLTALRMLPSCPKKMVALQAAARIRRALFPEADATRKKG